MDYIVVRNINDLCVQTRKSKLSEAAAKAEELIESGVERTLLIYKEIDNQEAKKKDWKQPTFKREFVCSIQ